MTEEIDDGKNGVVCWFYIYKTVIVDKPSICGIVIIKQLIDTIKDDSSQSESSSVTDNKIFFYAETNLKKEDTSNDPLYKYDNDDLIKSFIATKPNYNAFDLFIHENNSRKIKYGPYEELHNFLNDLINSNFDMFVNA
jgi:hypothetical protein